MYSIGANLFLNGFYVSKMKTIIRNVRLVVAVWLIMNIQFTYLCMLYHPLKSSTPARNKFSYSHFDRTEIVMRLHLTTLFLFSLEFHLEVSRETSPILPNDVNCLYHLWQKLLRHWRHYVTISVVSQWNVLNQIIVFPDTLTYFWLSSTSALKR